VGLVAKVEKPKDNKKGQTFMKRCGYIYEKVCDKENIRKAILRASKGKRKRKDVQKTLNNLTAYVDKVHELLIKESYVPSDYRTDVIREGIAKKERIISKPSFYPDQIIHWALILQLAPVITKGMYAFTCGSVPNRGVHYGKKYIEKWVRGDRKNTKYYLKMDVTKFYPSVDLEILEYKLRKIIKDKKVLKLIHNILSKEEGLPIGILLSQWFANFYLQDLDHYIKQELNAFYYMRYMDDMVIFSKNKKELHKMRKAISTHLASDNLKLKGNWQVCKFSKEALDFMGFRFFREKTILRRSIMLRVTRKIRKVGKKKKPTYHDACGVISYLGWVKHSDSYGLYSIWIRPYLKIQKLKNIIRKEMLNENAKIRKYGFPAGT
jgi:hypothetical protein